MNSMIESSLTLRAYHEQSSRTDRGPQSFMFPLLGLIGEVGSLLSEVKKQQRDTASYVDYSDNVREEMGDVLWYLTALSSRAQLSICDIAYAVKQGHADCSVKAPPSFSFVELQNQPLLFSPTPTPAFEETLLHLAGAVGSLVSDYQNRKLEDDRASVARHLIKFLCILVQAADRAGITLDEAARHNIQKISDRWPKERKYPRHFDDDFPKHEQLPRELAIEIFECPSTIKGKSYIMQRCNGIFIGDRLTDNKMTQDDYRFHDVFHYAYASVLGWSPVTRALFRMKRKSNRSIDESEDGARAILIEEGISTWIFGQAKRIRFFEDMEPGSLSFSLLKVVRQFVAGYEVDCRPLWLWEEAILQGYAAFRFLRKYRRGIIHINMHRNRLTVENLPI